MNEYQLSSHASITRIEAEFKMLECAPEPLFPLLDVKLINRGGGKLVVRVFGGPEMEPLMRALADTVTAFNAVNPMDEATRETLAKWAAPEPVEGRE